MDREFNRLAGRQDVDGNSDEEGAYEEKRVARSGDEGVEGNPLHGDSSQESDGETAIPDFNPTVKGTNPQNLIEKILRNRIYENLYWKEHCFGLTAADLVDKAVELTEVGGTYGPFHHPTRFIMLLLRMLEILPEKEIALEFIKVDEFRYLRLLGAFYMRLTGSPLDVYQYLEPLYNDYRKIRIWTPEGEKISHVDEFVWELVHGNFLCDISLPPIPKRHMLERSGMLGPRISVLDDEEEEEEEEEIGRDEDEEKEEEKREKEDGEVSGAEAENDDDENDGKSSKSEAKVDSRHKSDHGKDDRLSDKHRHHSRHHHHHRSRSSSRSRSRSRSKSRSSRHRHRSRSRSHRRSRSRSRSRSPRHHHSHRHSHSHKSRSHSKKSDSKRDHSRHTNDKKVEDPELAKMNELRVSIGLPPLDHL